MPPAQIVCKVTALYHELEIHVPAVHSIYKRSFSVMVCSLHKTIGIQLQNLNNLSAPLGPSSSKSETLGSSNF